MIEHDDIIWRVTGLVASVAGRCPISLDRLTLGLHESADKREAGELLLIDWARPGGAHVDTIEPEAEFVRRAGPVRALGAALLAAEKYHPACRDVQPLADLAARAEEIASTVEGGPEDRAERMALAARAVAVSLLGERGSMTTQRDLRGDDRSLSRDSDRPEARRPIDAWDFDVLAAVAFCGRGGALVELDKPVDCGACYGQEPAADCIRCAGTGTATLGLLAVGNLERT